MFKDRMFKDRMFKGPMFRGPMFNGPYLYPADGYWYLHYGACLGSVHHLGPLACWVIAAV